jgi:urease accessory protein
MRSRLEVAYQASRHAGAGIHHCAAFGLVCGAHGIDEDAAVLAYLQQLVAGLVSACQRLMPLGQTRAAQTLWAIKPALVAACLAQRDADSEPTCFAPLAEMASMRHPTLSTRLFIS